MRMENSASAFGPSKCISDGRCRDWRGRRKALRSPLGKRPSYMQRRKLHAIHSFSLSTTVKSGGAGFLKWSLEEELGPSGCLLRGSVLFIA